MVAAGVGIGTTAPNSNFQVASGLTTDLGGALKTGLLDTGYTAANAAAAVYNGTLSGSGPYLFTLTASNGNTYGNIPLGLTMPAGTSIIVTIIASSTSVPSSWGFVTSSVVPAYVFGALTGTLQTFTATINVQQPTSILGVWMSGAVGNNITFTSFTVRYASSGPTAMLGNVGIGTTMPTTANFQIVKGQTVDLGGALQTAWQTAWTDYSTSSLTIGYNSTSYTYASTTGTYTLSNAGTDGVLLPAFGVVAGSPYILQITLSTNGTQSPNSFTIRDRSNGTALTSVIINSITLPYVLQFTAPASGQIDFYISVGVSKILYITAFKLLRMDAMNVGIGTTAPGAILQVYNGNASYTTPTVSISDGAADNGGGYGMINLVRQGAVTDNKAHICMIRNGNYLINMGYYQGSNTFGFSHGTTGMSSGGCVMSFAGVNVGIGTTVINYPLQIGTAGAIIRIGGLTNQGSAADTTTYGLERSRNQIQFSGYRDALTDKIAAKIVAINKQTYGGVSVRQLIQSTDLAFFTVPPDTADLDNTVERLRITDMGNVGIGTVSPGPKFHVVGGNIGVNTEYGIGFRMDIGGYNNTLSGSAIYASGLHALRFVGESDSDAQRSFVFGHHTSNNRDEAYNSRFLINAYNGTIYPGVDNSAQCGGGGNRWSIVYAVNGAIQTSDSKEKDAIPLSYGINEILQMRTIKYKWKSQADLPDDAPEKNYQYYGFCADELAPIFPELVYNEDPKVPVQMNYSEIMPVMVNAIKEQNTTIVSLQAQVVAQASAISALEARLAALESK